MKGPYERLKYDLRRVWECPVCSHKERSTGGTTSLLCRCQQEEKPVEQKWMRLIEDGPRKTAAVVESSSEEKGG